MAGKSGRSINNVPENPMKHIIFSWEGILVILFILVNIFCASFSEFYNLKSVLRQMPVYLAEVFMMFPMAYILVLGEIDISVGAIVCLSATLSCMVCNTNAPFIVVVLTALVVGALCGAVNGFILTRFKELPPMIVTLATQIIFRGIAEVTLGSGGSIAVTNTDGFRAIGGKVGQVPYILFLVLILGVLFAIFLGKSTFGRRTYAIGTNRVAAYYAGVHVEKIRFIIYTVMGLMSGLCALFLVSSSYGANTTTGNGFEMDAIAMAVFGGISSTGGKGNLAGGIISAFIIVCLRVGLGQKNVNAQVILLIIGVLLAAGAGCEAVNNNQLDRVQEFLHKHNCNVRFTVGYGSSEGGSNLTFQMAPKSVHNGNVGIPMPLNDMGVFKPGTQEELGYNEMGEICTVGPGNMLGYDRRSATAKTLQRHADGKIWLHTGDIGYVDEDGVFYVLNRGAAFRYGGGELAVLPMENRLADAKIKGIKDEFFVLIEDEDHDGYFVPYLYVVLEDGYKVDDIIKDVQSCLEPYMFPVEILAIDERPFFHFKTNRIELSKELKKKNHDC